MWVWRSTAPPRPDRPAIAKNPTACRILPGEGTSWVAINRKGEIVGTYATYAEAAALHS